MTRAHAGQFRIASSQFGRMTYAANMPMGSRQLSENVADAHVYDHRDNREFKLKFWRALFKMQGFDPSSVSIEEVEPSESAHVTPFEQFTEVVRRNGWSVPQLRCDIPPSGEILKFMMQVGLDEYEEFVERYTTIDVPPVNRNLERDFQCPETQRDILLNGSRDDIIQWLRWNDPNGVWSDEDSTAEGLIPMTLQKAQRYMRNAIGGSPSELKVADSTSNDFDPNLPAGADEEACKEWLRRLCRDFGLGFHPDTPAADYIDGEGQSLPPEIVTALDDSIDRAFKILGDEIYEVCGEVAEDMMAELGRLREQWHIEKTSDVVDRSSPAS